MLAVTGRTKVWCDTDAFGADWKKLKLYAEEWGLLSEEELDAKALKRSSSSAAGEDDD